LVDLGRVGRSADRPVLAIDIGGTKLAAGVVGPDGAVTADRRVPTPRGERADAEALWSTLVRLAREVLDAAGQPALGGIGVGCGGPMTWPAGEVSPVHIPGWRGFGLRARLAAEFGGPDRLPVRVHNDAVCLVVAEHWRGAARGHPNALGMVVSTGVGGGLVLGGRVVDGATGNAGHIGHLVVDPDGPACPCGNRGCLEIVASGTSLARWAAEHGWHPPAGGTGSAREVAVAALAGDPVAATAFDRAGQMLGRGIAAAVTLVDVSVVTVGGGVAESGDLLFAPLHAAYAHWARFPYARAAQIVPATLGATAGLLGAAALVLAGDRYWNAD
jgi:glucokinase